MRIGLANELERSTTACTLDGLHRHRYRGRVSLGSSVTSFAVVAGLVTLTPGLDTALVLRATLSHGRRHAAATALGINTGVLIWALGAAIGVSALLVASEAAYTVVRFAGVAYMVVLGTRLIRHAVRGDHASIASDAAMEAGRSAWASYRTGLFTNLLNPKVGAFYVAVLPQFIPHGMPSAAMGALLAIVHNVEGVAWFSLLILGADSARRWLATPTTQRHVDGITGMVLIGFGAKLARSGPA